MRRAFAVIAVGCILMTVNACKMITDVQEPKQLRSRAETLRTKSAGLRKSAYEYDLLLKKSEQQIELYQTRLKVYRQRRDRLQGRISELKRERARASREKAQQLQSTIRGYASQLEVTQAKIDEQITRINTLRDHVEKQRRLKKAFIQKARAREEEARRLEKYADHLEQQG